MTFLILFLIFLIGLLVLKHISIQFSTTELIGMSFPMGLGLWSVGLMSADVFGLPVGSKTCALGIILSLVVVLSAILIFRAQKFNFKPSLLKPSVPVFIKKPLDINLAYVVMMGLIVTIVSILIGKSLYWPVINYDSINGFDFLAKLIKEENTINSSILSGANPAYSVRSFYPPLLVHALALTYIFEMGTSKIIPVLFLFSVIVTLYAYIKKENSHTLAALGVFILCITPEYISFNALISSNTPAALYLFIGLASYDLWLKKRERRYFILTMVGMALAVWTRTETIIFAFITGLSLLYKAWKDKALKYVLTYSIVTLTPFFAWQLYLHFFISVENAQPIITHLYRDDVKFSNMLKQMKYVMLQSNYFGYTIFILLSQIALNLLFLFKDKRMLHLSVQFIGFALLLVFVYYQIDTDYSSYSSGGWIGSGFKRGLFYFIPIGCYYIANSYLPKKIF